MSPQMSSVDAEYDIIFAGGGAAACVTAGRLAAADASLKILILEAGPPTKDLPIHTQPARYLSHLRPESTTMRFLVEPHVEALAGRSLIVTCGQCLGGGSSVNWAIYARPSASDFDEWETKYKNPGWGSKDIIPLLQKAETYQIEPDAPTHGNRGPLKVSYGGIAPNVSQQFMDIAARLDPARGAGEDTNDFKTLNTWTRFPKWIDDKTGRRSDAAHHYIYNQTNPNLHIVTNAHVQRILFDSNKRASGVQFKWNLKLLPDKDAEPHVVCARRLVVVSAGTFSSPGILERSGIGQSDVLRPLGIKVVEELPGVGHDFTDHINAFNCFLASEEAETIDGIMRNKPDVVEATFKEWSEKGTGLMATNGFDTLLKLRPNEGELEMLGPEFRKVWDAQFAHAPDKPVIFMASMASFAGDVTNVPDRKYFTSAYFLAYPVARGHVHVTSADDPAAPLDLKTGYCENIADVQPFILAYKIMREIARRNSFFRGEYAPTHPKFPQGSQAAVLENAMPIPFDTPKIVYTEEDDKAIEMCMRKTIGTAWHSIGTCAMKPREEGGVVDPRLNVYGVKGLKIADVSICPGNVAANTYSTAVAVGEKAAVIIAEDLGITLIE